MNWKLRPAVFRWRRRTYSTPLTGRLTGRFFLISSGISKVVSNVDLLRRQQTLHSSQIAYRHFVRNYWSLD